MINIADSFSELLDRDFEYDTLNGDLRSTPENMAQLKKIQSLVKSFLLRYGVDPRS